MKLFKTVMLLLLMGFTVQIGMQLGHLFILYISKKIISFRSKIILYRHYKKYPKNTGNK